MAPSTTLGSELKSSAIGFGCMGITAFYGPAMVDEDAVKLIQYVYEAGCNMFDTAEIYQQFNEVVEGSSKYNEVVVGKALAKFPRDSYVLATKFFPGLHDGKCDYETVSAAVNDSLSRLGVEYIDLYYLHRMPSTVEALEEWMRSIKAVVESGRVKYVGLSEVSPEWLRRAHAIHPVTAVQQEWSLLTRNLEKNVIPTCAELNIGVVAYSPLARNLLADTDADEPPKDWRAAHPRYSAENWQKNKELSKKVAKIAESNLVSSAQLSLKWLYQQAERLKVSLVAIPGTTKIAHAKGNIAAVDCADLTKMEMAQLAQLGDLVAGLRGDEAYLKSGIEGQGESEV